ncbi:hypothetical protein MAJ_07787, partial [Metarhizium majus ARSEF 297]
MQTSSALLLALGPVAYAASGDNTVQNQIALWVPNPCDRFWDLPNALRQSFINYNRDKVPDLNVITAYSTYTVASASPGPTDTWSFNNQGPTPVLTSAYNSANCSWYYPPPAASTSQPTSQPTGTAPTGTGDATETTDAETTSTGTTISPSLTASPTTTNGPSSTTNTAATSPPIDSIQTGSTTIITPSSTPTDTNTVPSTLVTSHTSANPTTSVPSSTSDTATSAAATTLAAGLSYTRISCFEDQKLWVNETLVVEIAIEFCQQISEGKIKPENEIWQSPSNKYEDKTNGVGYEISVRNAKNGSPAGSTVPNLPNFLDVCKLELYLAWKNCLGNGRWGGAVNYQGFDWTMQPKLLGG